MFVASKQCSTTLLKEDLARRIPQRNYAVFENMWSRVQPKLTRHAAVLEFLKDMASAKEDEDSAFRSVMSMDKSAFSRNERNKENLSQNSVTVTSISSSRSRPIDAERINAGFVVKFKKKYSIKVTIFCRKNYPNLFSVQLRKQRALAAT